MYINIGGAIEQLYSPTYKSRVVTDIFAPDRLIWLSVVKNELLIICSYKNEDTAKALEKTHNEIYHSPLASTMREML